MVQNNVTPILTLRCLSSLSVSLSLYLSHTGHALYLSDIALSQFSLCLSLYLSHTGLSQLSLSVSVSVSHSLSLSVCLSVCLSLSVSVSVSLSLSLNPSLLMSLLLFWCRFLLLSNRLGLTTRFAMLFWLHLHHKPVY